MRSTFKTLFYIKRNEPRKNGNVVIMVRITIDGERSQFSSKLEVHPDLWDNKTGRAKGNSSKATNLNRLMDNIRSNISMHYTRLMDSNGYVMPDRIKNALLGVEEKEKTIISYFVKHNEQYKLKVGTTSTWTTYTKYELTKNRFFVKGEGDILYSYNNGQLANDPKLAATNFLRALESMPRLLEKYKTDNEKISKDIPVLKSVVEGTWNKESELSILKSDLVTLDRKIQLSLKPIEPDDSINEDTGSTNINKQRTPKLLVSDAPMPTSLREINEAIGERLVLATPGHSFRPEKKELSKGVKL